MINDFFGIDGKSLLFRVAAVCEHDRDELPLTVDFPSHFKSPMIETLGSLEDGTKVLYLQLQTRKLVFVLRLNSSTFRLRILEHNFLHLTFNAQRFNKRNLRKFFR